jgi:hypothetical protein
MLNKRINMSNMKTERSQPFLVRLFLAIIAFKRMIAMRRKWEITKKQKLGTSKSTLVLEIHKSQRAVKYASFGRPVIDLDEERIRGYRQVEFERKEKEKEKRMEMQQLRTKRRFGMRSYGDMKQFESGPVSPVLDPYALTVADRIRAMKSKYSAADFYRDDSSFKKPPLSKQTLLINKEVSITTNKDLTNILQKNLHISKPPESVNQSCMSLTLSPSSHEGFNSLKNQEQPEEYEEAGPAGGSELCARHRCLLWSHRRCPGSISSFLPPCLSVVSISFILACAESPWWVPLFQQRL